MGLGFSYRTATVKEGTLTLLLIRNFLLPSATTGPRELTGPSR